VPGWVPKDRFYTEWITGIARKSKAAHLFGSLSAHERGESNAAILADANGTLVSQYNKRHLVPFGEYVPFGGFLSGLVPYLGQVGTFVAGHEFVHFDVNGVRLAPVIVNVTNDGWFLKTAAPEQHYLANIYRAVENGRPVLRAANTGISSHIDAYGRVEMKSSLMAAGFYVNLVAVPDPEFRTLYSRWGNWFGLMCVVIAVAAALRVGYLQRNPSF
jgi:apolipoprotein N-acyltransferase